jgi:hypothetical protein
MAVGLPENYRIKLRKEGTGVMKLSLIRNRQATYINHLENGKDL